MNKRRTAGSSPAENPDCRLRGFARDHPCPGRKGKGGIGYPGRIRQLRRATQKRACSAEVIIDGWSRQKNPDLADSKPSVWRGAPLLTSSRIVSGLNLATWGGSRSIWISLNAIRPGARG